MNYVYRNIAIQVGTKLAAIFLMHKFLTNVYTELTMTDEQRRERLLNHLDQLAD